MIMRATLLLASLAATQAFILPTPASKAAVQRTVSGECVCAA